MNVCRRDFRNVLITTSLSAGRFAMLWLVTALALTLSFTQQALAQSEGCLAINSALGAGYTAQHPVQHYVFPLSLEAEETVYYNVTSSGTTAVRPTSHGSMFGIFGDGGDTPYVEGVAYFEDEMSLNSSWIVPSTADDYMVYISGSELDPDSVVTATLTCTAGTGSAPSITSHPANQTIAVGANASFSVSADNATAYQWQVSTDTGASFDDIVDGGVYSGVETATLTITGATIAMAGYQYQAIAWGNTAPPATSNAATLTVNPTIPGSPTDVVAVAGNAQATVSFNAPGNDGGAAISSYTVTANPGGQTFVGSGSPILATGLDNGTSYAFIVSAENSAGMGSPSASSNAVTPTLPAPTITSHPSDATAPVGGTATFSVIATNATNYQWQTSANGGQSYSNVVSSDTDTLGWYVSSLASDGTWFRVVVSGPGGSVASQPAILTVENPASADASLSGLSLSEGTLDPAFASGVTSYSATVASAVDEVMVTPTSTDANATITVDGSPVPSGDASGPIGLSVGDTPIAIVVTAQDGTTIETYTVTVTRAAPLPPTIISHPASMTVPVGGTATFSVEATGATSYQWEFRSSGGTYRDYGVGTGQADTLTLTVPSPAFNGLQFRVVITGPGGSVTSSPATLTVGNPASSDAALSGLALSDGTLDPAFASGTAHYAATVPNETETIAVTPTASDAEANITVNGVTVNSGSASGPVALDVGPNTVTVLVTAEDGTATQSYTITVTREAPVSADSTLSGLGVWLQGSGDISLQPSFSSDTLHYSFGSVLVNNKIRITPTATDPDAQLMVNGLPVASGELIEETVDFGPHTFLIEVTAPNGSSRTYTIDTDRSYPLQPGPLDPVTVGEPYELRLNSGAVGIVSGSLPPGISFVEVNNRQALRGTPSEAGTFEFTMAIQGQHGAVLHYEYSIVVDGPASSDATLSGLALSAGTLNPVFASGTFEYQAVVGPLTDTIMLTPIADAHATITVNGISVASGSPSAGIGLAMGANPINVAVTAEDGVSEQTYTVTVNRTPPVTIPNNTLTGGWVGQSYSAQVAAEGGSGSYVYTIAQNSLYDLPSGLSLDDITGVISGTPTETRSPSHHVSITATDAANPSNDATAIFRLSIQADTTMPDGQVGVSYPMQRLSVGGSLEPTGGHLPPGLEITLQTNRPILTGIPEQAGNYLFWFEDGGRYTVTIHPGIAPNPIEIAPVSGPAEGGTEVTITGENLAHATGVSFGGTAAASFTVDGPSQITAVTPAGSGTVAVSITSQDGAGILADAFTYEAPASLALDPADGTALPEAMAGEDYSATIAASAGQGSVLFDIVDGALPPGLILNISTGEMTGPSDVDAQGTYTFTVEARDAIGNTGSATYTLTVGERAVTVTNHEVTVPEGGTPANVDLTAGATGGPFLDAIVVSVEPANAGTAEIVDTRYAQAGGGTPLQFYLRFTPNPSFSGQARVRYQLISSLGTSNVGTVVYNLSYDPVAVVDEIDTLVQGFVQTRQNLIASTVKVPTLLERRRLQAATDPIVSSLSPSANGLMLNFATSMARINAAHDAIDGIEPDASPFNIWIDGTAMVHNRDQNDHRWGSFAMISAGADYLLTDTALIGLSLHVDRMTDPTDADATLSGDGWLAGPYASFEIGDGVFWDTSLLYGGSSNTIDTAFWDGSFDTRRWLFDTAISGQWQLDAETTFTPKLRAVYLSETVQDYVVENGSGDALVIEGFTAEQLRVSLGAEIARQFTFDDGSVLTPTIGITGGVSGLDGSGAFASVSAGVTYQSPDDWTLDGGVLFNIDASGQTSVGARVGLGMRF